MMKTRRKPEPRPDTAARDVACPRCKGTGAVPLSGVYLRTLDLLSRQGRPVNATELARLARVAPEAMANRLVRLEGLGLATGPRNGRERLWSATAKDGTR